MLIICYYVLFIQLNDTEKLAQSLEQTFNFFYFTDYY